MSRKPIVYAVVASALVTGPVTRAAADAGDFIGGVAAGVLGSAIANSQRQKQRTVVVRQAPNPQ